MHEEHENQVLLKIAPFPCKQLKTVDVQFCKFDKTFPRVVKYVQDGVEKSKAQINMFTFPSELFHVVPQCVLHR
jgi:hypothetical protein